MVVEEPRLAGDDEPVGMTVEERTVWAYLITVLVTSGAYYAVMIPRLLSRPVEEISWVGPMLWTMGFSIVGTILLAAAGGCLPSGAVASDVRDKEIGRLGGRASMGVLGVGFAGALGLAMLDAHTFWIGNLLFLCGTAGALVETTTKIRLYRRGF